MSFSFFVHIILKWSVSRKLQQLRSRFKRTIYFSFENTSQVAPVSSLLCIVDCRILRAGRVIGGHNPESDVIEKEILESIF